ncbi:hypothetical protein SANTM175S_06208 [Streptomyces antimycoticus]
MAPADSGSNSSTGAVSGATSGVHSSCGPSPIRTCTKSSSVIRRSHSRLPSATSDHSCSGEGWRKNCASRCVRAVRCTLRRVFARYLR